MQVCPDAGAPISLCKLLPDMKVLAAEDVVAARAVVDSRRVTPGDLFVAIVGTNADGNRHIEQAVSRGCAAIVTDVPPTDPSLIERLGVPVAIVPNAREAFGRICQARAGNPSTHLKVVGVTGTNGKTTVSCLIAGILTKSRRLTGILGTLGYTDGCKVTRAKWTTPPANVLADKFARMVANDCEFAVMEASSHGLAQDRLAGVTLDRACLTNITGDHLDYHGDFDAYLAAKQRLFDLLSPKGVAIINTDDPVASDLARRINRPMLTVGIDSPADVTAMPLEEVMSEQTFLLVAGSEAVPVRTEMIGRHHIQNCLVAAAVALTYEIELVDIARGLESVGHVPGRLQRIECGQPFAVYIDYAHTPDALSRSLAALRPLTRGRLVCVFGAGGDRDHSKRPLMAQAASAGADLAIITTDNPRTERPQAIIDDIRAGFDGSPDRVTEILDRREAIQWALAEATAGDCVIIAGKGHEREQVIGRKRIPFDDAMIAREWLYQIGPSADSDDVFVD